MSDIEEKKDTKANAEHPEEVKPTKTADMIVEENIEQVQQKQKVKRKSVIWRSEGSASKKVHKEYQQAMPDIVEKKDQKTNVEHPEEVKRTKTAGMIVQELLEELKQEQKLRNSGSSMSEGNDSSSEEDQQAMPDNKEKKDPKANVEHPEEVKPTKTADMIVQEMLEELKQGQKLRNSGSSMSEGNDSSSEEDQALPDNKEKNDPKANVERPEEVKPIKTADVIAKEIIERIKRNQKHERPYSSSSEGNVSKKIRNDECNFSSPRQTFEFVGIRNQGATCYMNSVLQTLYFTNELRKAVHMMPIRSEDPNKCVAFALQRIFFDLQFSDKAVQTTHLTNALGWEDYQAVRQHDVQEFLRALLEQLEIKMRDTVVEGTIPRLFKGEMRSFIKCKFVDYESTRTETFYDIQLNIKGKKNLKEAFNDYVKAEVLDGDNKYDAGIHGLQEAEKGVMFTRFPPVLHLHLLRFQYDPINNCLIKFNDRFEFSEKLDLSEYLESEDETCCTYTLQSVLVHIGHDNAGHYIVYIDPKGNGKWFKFNDSNVVGCSKYKAIQNNYGLTDEQAKHESKEKAFSAYMLVYIKDSELANVLQDVSIDDIPKHVEYNHPTDLRITVNALLEDSFERHTGLDLFDPKTANYITLKVEHTITLHKFIELLAVTLNYLPDNMRLWPIYPRTLNVFRPTYLSVEYELGQPIGAIADDSEWNIYVELLPTGSIIKHLPLFDEEWDVLLFFKMYDPKDRKLSYCGHFYASIHSSVAELIPILNERAGFPFDTELEIYEEISPGQVEMLTDIKRLSLRKSRNGDILLFQKKLEFEEEFESYPLPSCIDYFRHYLFLMNIQFCDKMMLNDQFILKLSAYMSYNQMAKAVALHLHTEPCNLTFFEVSKGKDMGPGMEIRKNFKGFIEQLFIGRSQPTLYFEKLKESDKKVPFKVTFLKSSFLIEEEEVILYVRQKATVAELIQEAKIAVKMDCDGSRNLRLLDVKNNRINPMGTQETIMDPRKSYRIEEIPMDELIVNKDEVLIPVFHFYKYINKNFGSPFLVKIVNRETAPSLKEKIFKKACIEREVFQQLEIFVIYGGIPISISEDISFKIGGRPSDHPKIWIGINHDYEK